jgi:hypothetical protein
MVRGFYDKNVINPIHHLLSLYHDLCGFAMGIPNFGEKLALQRKMW